MLRQPDFLEALGRLLASPVDDLPDDQKLAAARALIDQIDRAAGRPAVEIVPFVTGRRPGDEAMHPGLGSSDNAALVLGAEPGDNRAVVLYRVTGIPPGDTDGLALDATLTVPATDGRAIALPNWHHRPIDPRAHRPGEPTRLDPVPLDALAGRTLAFNFSPDRALSPGADWTWTELDPALRAEATEDGDLFTFGHRLHQRLRVELRLTRHGVPLAAGATTLDVCDVRQLGALYRRVLDRVVRPDAEAQAAAAGAPDVDAAHHPWYPVLHIGADKAALYTRALIEDIAHKQRHLTDPAWLMRVGLYLELLTCIGIFEAVAADIGDLLTPAERHAYATHPAYRALRERVDVEAWRAVWALRPMQFPRWSTPRMGPVSALNLLAKKRATLAFLEAHHKDLEHAIDLAGANEHNAQETWHRVFRDAERAVLRKTPEAFPELGHANDAVRDFVLWHRRGRLDLPGLRHIPAAITTLFGDQDGLYAAACNQYRASMNAVAAHARAHGLMGWSGAECVPTEASLFEAHMSGNTARFARLQRRDGYAATLDVQALVPEPFIAAIEDIEHLLAGVALFQLLDDEERRDLALRARPIHLGPIERILVQGASGSSLFIVADGELEVLWRRDDGVDLPVGHLTRGSVFGEMALLTGAPRSATVRSIEHATLYEVCRDHLAPILTRRPALVDELVALITRREQAVRDAGTEQTARGRRWHTLIRELFLGA